MKSETECQRAQRVYNNWRAFYRGLGPILSKWQRNAPCRRVKVEVLP